MPRPELYVTESCPTCKRGGYVKQLHYALSIGDEISRLGRMLIADLDVAPDVERALATNSATITEAVREACQWARAHSKKIAFDFNGGLVICTPSDDPEVVWRTWWMAVYGVPFEVWQARR